MAVRVKALGTAGELIRGHSDARAHFAQYIPPKSLTSTTAPTDENIIARVISLALNSKIPKEQRAALYTIQSYLFSNNEVQRAIASTAAPTPNDEISLGRQLVKAWLDWETGDEWKTVAALNVFYYLLDGNLSVKETLLKIPAHYATTGPSQHVDDSLFSHLIAFAFKAIQTQVSHQIQIAFLKVLAQWLDDCDAALKYFLHSTQNLNMVGCLICFQTHTKLIDMVSSNATNIQVSGIACIIVGECLQVKGCVTNNRP